MDGIKFEQDMVRLLRLNGYTNVETTKASGDFGVDILAEKNGWHYAIQCKDYSGAVGVDAVQEVYAGKAYYDCDFAVVATSSTFTKQAEEYAEKLRVELWDEYDIARMGKIGNLDGTSEEAPKFSDLIPTYQINGAQNTDEFKNIRFLVGANEKTPVECAISQCGHVLITGMDNDYMDDYFHTVILSLVTRHSQDMLRAIMIDSRMLNLNVYGGIPHLLIPVVTEVKRASGTLAWLKQEIERRYTLLADYGCRNIDQYNKRTESLPGICVFLSDLGDFLHSSQPEAIQSIQYILNAGSKVGCILFACYRNPVSSKAFNSLFSGFQTKISLSLTSDASRLIFQNTSAYRLNPGELLYYSGLYRGEHMLRMYLLEFESVKDYVEAVKEKTLSEDELFSPAVEVVLETGQASVSMLQRRLKLGYARAARLVDEMEERGIVGPFEGSKPRQLLIDRKQWEKMKTEYVDAVMNKTDKEQFTYSLDHTLDGLPRPDHFDTITAQTVEKNSSLSNNRKAGDFDFFQARILEALYSPSGDCGTENVPSITEDPNKEWNALFRHEPEIENQPLPEEKTQNYRGKPVQRIIDFCKKKRS